MCDNCKNCKGNVGNIALPFKTNSVAIQAVFTKYGMGKMEPTPKNALTGTIAYGEPFAKEIALAAAGIEPNQSNATGEDTTQNMDLASQIFTILGSAANTGINIAKGVTDIKNSNKPGYTPISTPNPTTGQPQVVYIPQPQQPQAQGSFSNNQLLLLVVAAAAIVGVIFLLKGKKKGA